MSPVVCKQCGAPVADVQRPPSGKLRDRLFSVVFKFKEGRATEWDVYEAIDETIDEASQPALLR